MAKSPHDQKVHRPEVEGRGHEHDDDIIVAPKGSKRTRFVLTFVLVVFLLTMFAVSDEFVSVLTGESRRGGAWLSWTDPSGTQRSLSAPEFQLEMQTMAKAYGVLFGRHDREHADDDAATFTIIADAAEHAGIRVTDGELRKVLEGRFPPGSYMQVLQANRVTPPEFEGAVRKMLAIERYQSLIAAPLTIAKPSEVESLWKARHQEYAFDYVELSAEVLRAEAEPGLPADPELEAWFNALPEHKREPFRRQLAVSAELAVFPLGADHSAERLFAKYPRPADEDADAAGKEYHDGYGFLRFRNKNLPTDRPPTQADFVLPFDDVKEVAKREAAIFRSLGDWRTSLATRSDAGETINFAVEAEELGLVSHTESSPKTQAEWAALEVPWTGKNLSDFIVGMPEIGKFFPAVSVDEKSLVVGRTLAKEDPRMPAFAEIREKVKDEWLRQRMSELAIAKLEEVRKKLGTWPDPSDPAAVTFVPEVDAETFKRVATESGYEVVHRDWAERAKAPSETPAAMYLRGAGQLYSSKVNAVPKPEIARDGKNAYLVRIDGLRDADPKGVSPLEFDMLADQAVRQSFTDFRNRTFSSREFLKERFDAHLRSWETQAQQ